MQSSCGQREPSRRRSVSCTSAMRAKVYGFHLRRTSDADAAHDLTAETFAQAWLVRHRFRDPRGRLAGPWLFGIARNLMAQSVRRRRIELGRVRETRNARRGWIEPRATVDRTRRGTTARRGFNELPDGGACRGTSWASSTTSPTPRWPRGSTRRRGAARVRVCPGARRRLRERLTRDEREAVLWGQKKRDWSGSASELEAAAAPHGGRRLGGGNALRKTFSRSPAVRACGDRESRERLSPPRHFISNGDVGAEPARRDAVARRHRSDLHDGDRGRRVPLRAGEGAGGRRCPTGAGTVEPTVDATKHVNGGCRSLNSAGDRMGVLHRPGRGGPEDHRPGVPRSRYEPAPGVG